MMNSKNIFTFIFSLFVLLVGASAANVYNSNGDYTVTVDSLTKTAFNDQIESSFTFTIENKETSDAQRFNIIESDVNGWDINPDQSSFRLKPGESKKITVDVAANKDFQYNVKVSTDGDILIGKDKDYNGRFSFPIVVSGADENVSLVYTLNIIPREDIPVKFTPRVSTSEVSPVSPLKFTVTGEELLQSMPVSIKLTLGDYTLYETESVFTQTNFYQIYTVDIPSNLDPGKYPVEIIVRAEDSGFAQEWSENVDVNVVEYNDLQVTKASSSELFKDMNTINLKNNGNVKAVYQESIEVPMFKKLFMSSNTEFEDTDNGLVYTIVLEKGDSKQIVYTYNYLFLYLLMLFFVLLLIYAFVRKASNPLVVETKIYDVKRVEHEGVKSIKMRIAFENIKEDSIDDLKVIFRMPTYLQIKEGSFLLSPPKHALRGRNQYKLIWEFKKFDKNDSRVLGFTLVNTRGILGDIKVPGLEFEVRVGGKTRTYYESFPLIRG